MLALFREGETIREDLRNTALRFGDAILLYGSRQDQAPRRVVVLLVLPLVWPLTP